MKAFILTLFTLISINLFSQTSTVNAEKYMIVPKNQSSKTRFITDNIYAKNKLCIGCDTSKSASNSFPFWTTTDARFDGKIHVGGSYGQNGNVLISRGSSLSPIWGSLDYNTLSNKPSLDMLWQKNNLFGVSGYVLGSDQPFVNLGADGQKVAQWNKTATTGKLSGFSQIAINSGFNLFTSETVGGYQFEVGGRGVFGYNPNMPTSQRNNDYYKLMIAKQSDANTSELAFGKWEASGQTYTNKWNLRNDNWNRLAIEKNSDTFPYYNIDTTSSAYFGQNRFVFGGKYGVDDAKFIIRGKLAVVDGTQGEDYIFTSNANGVGSWRSKYSLNIQEKIGEYSGNFAIAVNYKVYPPFPSTPYNVLTWQEPADFLTNLGIQSTNIGDFSYQMSLKEDVQNGNGYVKKSGTSTSYVSSIPQSDISGLSSTLSTYLPLSGGTLSNSIRDVLELNTTNANGVSMIFRNNSTAFGKIGSAYYDVNGSALSDVQLNATNSGKIHLVTGGFSRLAITSTGNVGVGTATATEKLHVVGTGLFTGLLTGTGSAQFSGVLPIMGSSGIYLGTSSSFPYVGLRNQSATTDNKLWDAYADGTTLYNRVVNDANSVASTWQQVVRNGTAISSISFPNGNVGINTTSPITKFHVKSSTQAVGDFQQIIEGFQGGYGAGFSFQSALGTSGVLTEMARITADGEAAWSSSSTSTQVAGLRFYTNNGGTISEKVRIVANGNMGIGTTTPSRKLHVSGTAQFDNTVYLGSEGFWTWNGGATNTMNFVAGTSRNLSFGANSTYDQFYITTVGRVGIGTTNPFSNLEIGGASNKGLAINSALNNKAFVSAWQDGAYLGINREPATGSFVDVTKMASYISTSGSTTDSRIEFATTNTVNTLPSVRGVFDKDGNFGIGTTSPSYKLDVSSSIRVQQDGFAVGVYSQGAWRHTGSGGAYMDFNYGGSASFVSFRNGSSLGEALRIDGFNRVGINTSNPQATLDVQGSTRYMYSQKSANYSIIGSDHFIEITANSPTITLPTAVGVAGLEFKIVNSGSGTVTVNTTSSQTINGTSTRTLTQWQGATFVSNGANWIVFP